ncbi:hypothetical protein L195_g032778, partial [Trifolium pratense]
RYVDNASFAMLQVRLQRATTILLISPSYSRLDTGLFGSKESRMLFVIYRTGLLVCDSVCVDGQFSTLGGACRHLLIGDR